MIQAEVQSEPKEFESSKSRNKCKEFPAEGNHMNRNTEIYRDTLGGGLSP